MRALWSPDEPRRIPNHDVADALGLATAGAIHLGWRMPFRLRRCHVENVALVTWPEIPAAPRITNGDSGRPGATLSDFRPGTGHTSPRGLK